MPKTPTLILAGKQDPVAGAMLEFARRHNKQASLVSPEKFWSTVGPEMHVSRQGQVRSNLSDRPIFSRLGTYFPFHLDDWRPEDRHYVWMEAHAALLAFLAAHPSILNAPKPDDFSGCGLRLTEQFVKARLTGLDVPAWIVTSRPESARQFLKRNGGAAIYRENSEDVFSFPLARPDKLPPIMDGSLLGPVFLMQGRVGYMTVTTYATGKMWHFDVIRKRPVHIPGVEGGLKTLFQQCGLRFAQAVGILSETGLHWTFYGMTGTPQLRHYLSFADEVHQRLFSWAEEAI